MGEQGTARFGKYLLMEKLAVGLVIAVTFWLKEKPATPPEKKPLSNLPRHRFQNLLPKLSWRKNHPEH